MNNQFADRMSISQKSFIREILKVTQDSRIISFAGGLPNPAFFPVDEISRACVSVLSENGAEALQYTTTEGYYPLREFIADRYMKKRGLKVHPDQIMITEGSQQGLDLIGKVFLNKGDNILIEKPGYLGAIQAFTMYEPQFVSVPLLDDGADIAVMEKALKQNKIKMYYTVPNFQNPSGVSYSMNKRHETADLLRQHDTLLVEDDAYGELRFLGEDLPLIKSLLPGNSILLGTFSKIISPGLRLGWICADPDILDKLVIAKQATDLHSNNLSQRLVYRYLVDNDIDSHIARIREGYCLQRNVMISSIERYFPGGVKYTKPEGGMFVWIELPEGISSMELFDMAIKENVAFVPGNAFYTDGSGSNTLRLNYSNSDSEKIEEGIKRLAKVMEKMLG